MKKNFFCVSFFSLLISFLTISCGIPKEGKIKDKISNSEIRTNVSRIWNNTTEYTFAQKEHFKRDVENAEEKLSNKIDAIQQKAGTSRGNTKVNYNKAVEKLKEEKEVLNKKMSNFNGITKENWNDFKSGVNSVWSDIEKTWENINENG